jgi:hypothetical protein
MSAGNFINTLNHPIDLADGRVIEAGEAVKLTAEQARDSHNKTLIADGTLQAPPKEGDKPDEKPDTPDSEVSK